MRHIEESIQEEFFLRLEIRYASIYKLCFHIPNGGHRHIYVATKLKRQGVKPGVGDVFVMIPSYRYHGLFIEFKSPTGVQSLHQKEFEQRCIAMNYEYKIARSADEAMYILQNYIQE